MNDTVSNQSSPPAEFCGNAEEIEQQIHQAREEMTQTVDDLVDRLHPKNQVKTVKKKAVKAFATVRETVRDASQGDTDSQKKLGIAAAVLAGLVVLKALKPHH